MEIIKKLKDNFKKILLVSGLLTLGTVYILSTSILTDTGVNTTQVNATYFYENGTDISVKYQNDLSTNDCNSGNYVRAVADDGTVTCEADTDTTVDGCSDCLNGTEVYEGQLSCSNITGGGGLCDGGDAYDADTTVNGCSGCLDIGGEVVDDVVDTSGDTMSGALDMGGNELDLYSGSYELSKFVTAEGYTFFYVEQNTSSDGYFYAAGDVNFRADSDSGYYDCEISETDGTWYCDGTKDALLEIDNETYHTHASEGTKVWFRDEGTSQLENGVKTVEMSEAFKKVISNQTDLRAHITPKGKCDLYVSNETWHSFTVKGWDGPEKNNCEFNWQVTAVRIGYEPANLTNTQPREGYPEKTAPEE